MLVRLAQALTRARAMPIAAHYTISTLASHVVSLSSSGRTKLWNAFNCS
jgi:hypothetical protein